MTNRLGFLPDLCSDPAPVYYRQVNLLTRHRNLKRLALVFSQGSTTMAPSKQNFGPSTYHSLSDDDAAAAEKLNPTLKPLESLMTLIVCTVFASIHLCF
jgi:hypothetical protein